MTYAALTSARLRSVGLFALAVGVFVLATTGCVRLLEPRTSDATYYLLHDARDWSPRPADTTGLRIGIRQPRLAPYLGPTRIVTRRGAHTLQFSEFHRWAEDLSQGIPRTVALLLADRAGIQLVETVPWPEGTTFDYVVQLHVHAFEGVGPPSDPKANEEAPAPEGHSHMAVRWAILEPGTDTVLARGLTRHRTEGWRVGNYGALADNLGTALTMLADDLEARLTALDRR